MPNLGGWFDVGQARDRGHVAAYVVCGRVGGSANQNGPPILG